MVETYTHPELVNLAEELKDDELAEIGAQVVADYNLDEESRQEWLSMHADWERLYYQIDRPQNAPWEGSSDESLPILAEACNQFHARAFQAMFPNPNIIKGVPTGKPDEQSRARGERIGQHLSWQLMTQDKTYKRNKDRLLLSLPLHGMFFTKVYRCPLRQRNITDNVRAMDLVFSYGTGPRDLEDIPRKTHIIWMPKHKAKKLVTDGFFIGEPEDFDYTAASEKTEVDDSQDEAQGTQEPGYAEGDQVKLLEQHRFWDLDDDGVDEPYIITVDAETEQVKRISIRYDVNESGEATDNKEPVEYFTAYPFLDNPNGTYALGFGHLIGQINKACNKLLRQTVDSGTLANAGNMSGIISKALSLKKGEFQIQLGKFTTTEHSVEDLRKGIFQFQFPGPQPVLQQQMELLMARSDRLATVTEAITGQTEKVMQPTTVLALIEQSLQVFSTIYERVLDSWTRELEKHYRLNRKFMDPVEYFSVLDITGELQEGEAARDDYADDMQVMPTADPKMSTERQKIARAEAEYNFALTNPLVANSPIHLYNASKRYLEAIGAQNSQELIPKPTDQLPRVDDPAQENVGALSPVPIVPPAYIDQDHIAHIRMHQGLLDDPVYGPRLGVNGRIALEEHIQAHAAMMYGMTESEDGPGLGLDALALPGRDAGVLPAVTGDIPPERQIGNGSLQLGGGAEVEGSGTGSGGDV